nr:hypothetical protein [Tanacetum cinerariifolium]
MIGELTGSKVKIGDLVMTTRGWTSLLLSLLVGCTVSLVASISFSTTEEEEEEEEEEEVGIMGPRYEVPLLVVIPFRSSFRLVIVLPERVLEPEDEADGIICLHEIYEFIGGDNLMLRNLGLMNRILDDGFLDSCSDSEHNGSGCFGFDFG